MSLTILNSGRETIRDVLQGIQEELDELLDRTSSCTDDEHLPLEYLKKHHGEI